MIVFDNKTQYAVSGIPNSEIYGGLLDFARAQGVPVYKTMKPETYETFPTLFWYAENGFIDGSFLEAGHPRFTWITIDQFIQACKEYKDAKEKAEAGPVTVALGDGRTAIVDLAAGVIQSDVFTLKISTVRDMHAAILKAEAKN